MSISLFDLWNTSWFWREILNRYICLLDSMACHGNLHRLVFLSEKPFFNLHSISVLSAANCFSIPVFWIQYQLQQRRTLHCGIHAIRLRNIILSVNQYFVLNQVQCSFYTFHLLTRQLRNFENNFKTYLWARDRNRGQIRSHFVFYPNNLSYIDPLCDTNIHTIGVQGFKLENYAVRGTWRHFWKSLGSHNYQESLWAWVLQQIRL